MKSNEIKAIAERYEINHIYLFGSQADKGRRSLGGKKVRGGAFSDLDIAISFGTSPAEIIEIYGILYKELSKIFEDFDIDLVFMHEVDTLFQYEIIKGERIYEKNGLLTDEFEEGIMRRAEDLLFKKRILDNEIMEAIEDGYFEFEYSPNP